ncbi:MAG: hypothetical protein WD425_19485 [Nitrospirales bacterium]
MFNCAANLLRGHTGIFCGSFKVRHTSRPPGKASSLGSWKGNPACITKGVETVSAEELIRHIQAKTRKGFVYYTDAFRGYQSLKRSAEGSQENGSLS